MLSSFSGELGKILPATLKTAYNDGELVGGGVARLNALFHRRLRYCGNTDIKNGKYVCGRLIPDSHEGHVCPNKPCKHDISRFDDHVIELKHLYPLLMQHTDLLQRIADYYPISKARLSQGAENKAARVWCVESGYIARRDYERNPSNFTLDILPKLSEKALFDTGGALELCEVVEAEGVECDKGMYKIKLFKDGSVITVWDEDRSKVQKIGSTIPVNVITFVDGQKCTKIWRIQTLKWREEPPQRTRKECVLREATPVPERSRYNVQESFMPLRRTESNYAPRQYTTKRVQKNARPPRDGQARGTMGLRNVNSMSLFIHGFQGLNLVYMRYTLT